MSTRPLETVGDAPELERGTEEEDLSGLDQHERWEGSSRFFGSSLLRPLLLAEDYLPIDARQSQINVSLSENEELQVPSDRGAPTLLSSTALGPPPPPPYHGLYVFYFCHGLQDELPSMALYLVLKGTYDMQPADYSFVSCLLWLPWALKPAVGYWSDACRIGGRRRTPHAAIGIVLNLVGCLLLSSYPYIQSKLLYLTILIFNSLAAVVAETAVDSIMAELSKLAPVEDIGSLQSTVWTLDAAGSVVGSIIPIVAFGIDLPPCIVLLLSASVVVVQALAVPFLPEFAARDDSMDPTLPSSWRACSSTIDGALNWVLVKALIFVFLVSSTPTSSDAFTYYQSDVLNFGAGFLSATTVLQAFANWVSATAFTARVRKQHWDANDVFRVAIVLTSLVNVLNLVVVERWNVVLGIPDKAVVVSGAAVQGVAGELAFLPVAVLASQLAPAGHEGTVYATVMAVVNVAWGCSELFSGLLSSATRVSNGQYDHLPLLLIVMTVVALLPLGFLGFVPDITSRDADRRSEELPPGEFDELTGDVHESNDVFEFANPLDEDDRHRHGLLTNPNELLKDSG